MKASKTIVLILVFFLLHSNYAVSKTRTDTICFGPNFCFKISYPDTFSEQHDAYEEGFLKVFYNPAKTSAVIVKCGALMSTEAFFNARNLIITQCEALRNFTKTMGYALINNVKYYFRKDIYNNSLSVLYIFVKEKDIEQFNQILDSIFFCNE